MIDKLRRIAIFSSVVDQGSFRAAARHLGLAPSRVSQSVSDLEKEIGVTLLYRSTRHLSLTQEGRILHEQARAMLAAAEIGLDAINPLSTQPAGLLRISAPAFVTQTDLMDDFAEFAKAHPNVSLDLHFTDQQHDIIKDGFDLAIRAGWPQDSDLRSRKIGRTDRHLVASPDYVAARPAPDHPNDLKDWDWIRFIMRADKADFISRDGTAASVSGKYRVTVNSAAALYEFAVRGLGVSAIPDHLAKRGYDRGELVQILPEWSLQPLGIYAIWPDKSRRENLTTLFVRFLSSRQP